jgi:Regulator of chromosome condensation (RCC1) repeat
MTPIVRGLLLMGTSAALTAALALGTTTAAWADVLYVDISAGDAHTCAVKANGEIDCWGDNSFGQANPGTSSGSPSISFLDEDLKVSLPPGQSVMDLAPITVPAGLNIGAFFLEAAVLDPVTEVTLSRHHVVRELRP